MSAPPTPTNNTENVYTDRDGPGYASPTRSGTLDTLSPSMSVAEMPIIPPDDPLRPRTLVLCFDGTGDQFDTDNSNIVQLFSMLKKGDRERQMVYYQTGIGTYTTPQIATPIRAKISRMIDTAIARSLDTHVMDGYEFLMQNYTSGDRICIFGFSRGAYTARSLAGMLHKVGLLPACNHRQVPFAYKMYMTTDAVGWKQSNAFKKAFSIDVDIEFIGVWDTVNSVGLVPKHLPFTTSNVIVRTFRHAVSLDERRAKFKPNLWNRPNDAEQLLSASDQERERRRHERAQHEADPRRKQRHEQKHMEQAFSRYTRPDVEQTDIEEVWFAGCHCDVGGGSVDNDTPSNLARIPLRWMIRECFKANTGIMFHTAGLRSIGLDPESLFPIVKPRPPALPLGEARIRAMPVPAAVPTPATTHELEHHCPDGADSFGTATATTTPNTITSLSEEEHDLRDALAPIYDQLSLSWWWWILELFPLRQHYQRGNNNWASYIGMNMGKGRFIPKQKVHGVKVHRSVKMRLEAECEMGGKGYTPKAAFDLAHTHWVD